MQLRRATLEDVAVIEQLIAASARELSRPYYEAAEVEAAIRNVFGVDSMLIADGTYFVVEIGGSIRGCGGWSKRRTLFGGDQYAAREAGLADPKSDPAKIRAFFVHPDFARQGIARTLLARCELEATNAGYRSLELMSTLPGVSFYKFNGYASSQPTSVTVEGVEIRFVPMTKSLS